MNKNPSSIKLYYCVLPYKRLLLNNAEANTSNEKMMLFFLFAIPQAHGITLSLTHKLLCPEHELLYQCHIYEMWSITRLEAFDFGKSKYELL